MFFLEFFGIHEKTSRSSKNSKKFQNEFQKKHQKLDEIPKIPKNQRFGDSQPRDSPPLVNPLTGGLVQIEHFCVKTRCYFWNFLEFHRNVRVF